MWSRRRFLKASGWAALAAPNEGERPARERDLTLLLTGDVMTGRGIDQVLPHRSKPRIHEAFMTSALGYVRLAEDAHGPIPRPVSFAYVWGDALAELEARSPDLRIVNLETSVTTSEEALPKGINYRMHPANVPCLSAARIDCCMLANNHVLDWGVRGLRETLASLRAAGLATAGAGGDAAEAERPAALDAGRTRVLVFGFGSPTSGIPLDWAATASRPGVCLLPDLSNRAADEVAERTRRWRRPGDRMVASVHWGGNWGYEVPDAQRSFAHRLVDEAGIDIVHGHSSHHPKGIEVYQGRLVLYGCGDFLNDYEGITGQEEYRGDLVLAYLATVDPFSGRLLRLEMIPFQTRCFRLRRAQRPDAEWLQKTLDREGRALGTRVELTRDGALALFWS